MCFVPPNVWLHALGGCGVSAFAKQQIKMRVKNSKSAPISQVGCNRLVRPVRPKLDIVQGMGGKG